MKKILALVLALALTFALVGCGGTAAETAAPESTAPESTAPESTEPETEPSAADSFPSGPVNILNPNAPGGGTDLASRILAKYLEAEWGVPVTITNQDGASGAVAAQTLFAAEPDGQTLYFYHNSFLLASIKGVLDFVPQEAMAPVALFCRDSGLCLFVDAEEGLTDMQSFIDDAKANPGKYSMPVNVGGASQLLLASMNEQFGIDIKAIDMSSDAEKIAALLGGTVNVIPVAYKLGAQYVESGDFSCIGMVNIGADTNPFVPDEITSAVEQGIDFELPGFDFHLYAPKDTDPAIIQKIADSVEAATQDPTVQEELENIGYYPEYLNPTDLMAHLTNMYDGYMELKDVIIGG